MLYCQELCKLENNFDGLEYLHILRGETEIVDKLAKLGSSRAIVLQGSFCRNSCHWLKPARWLSHPRKLHHRLRAYLSHLKS
jgi:hypothetical protein